MARDLYQEVTDRIIFDMESGSLPWEKSWDGSKRVSLTIPRNATTNRPYRGINILMLWGLHADPRYCTYKQARDAGGSVKKGEHGYSIVFYTPLNIKDKQTGEEKKIPLLKNYTVFHISQTEGCSFPTPNTDDPIIPEDTAELIEALKINLTNGGDQPCYIPSLDQLRMPYSQDFKCTDNYRATLYHEIGHWTGHKTRLDRNMRNSFGSQQYAREELVAELCGAFMCAEFNIPYQTQHASYLASWLSVLKEDKRAILQAASAAQKAVDYIRSQILGAETTEEEAA